MGFDFGSLKKETGTSLASKQMANVGEERIQHMYKLLPFLKTWYQENERNNKFQEFNLFSRANNGEQQHNATYIKKINFFEKDRKIDVLFAKPTILGPTISGENEYHLIIIEKNNRTIDIITNCLCIDVGLLYYLSKVDYSFIKINGIFFDISDIPMYNYVYNIPIVDSQNMYVSFPIQNIPDCLYTNFKIPKICLIHKNYNLHEQLLENTIKINIFINYANFNILLREQAISFTKVFNSIECEFPYKLVYQSVFDITDPVFEYELTKDLIYQPVKLKHIIYNSEQFINKYHE